MSLLLYIFNGKVFPHETYAGTERMVKWEVDFLNSNFQKFGFKEFLIILPKKLNFEVKNSLLIDAETSDIFFKKSIDLINKIKPSFILTRGGVNESKYFNNIFIPTIITVDGYMLLDKQNDIFISQNPFLKFRFLSQNHFNYCTNGNIEMQNCSIWAYHGLPDECFLMQAKNYDSGKKELVHCQAFGWGFYLKGLNDFLTIAEFFKNNNNSNYYFKSFGCGDENISNFLLEKQKELNNFEYCGALDDSNKKLVYENSLGFFMGTIAPYQEPFGLAQIEAMACGCPVFYLRRNHNNNGTISEIQNPDDKRFFNKISVIIENYNDFEKLLSIDRNLVLSYTKQNFSIDIMFRTMFERFNLKFLKNK